MISPRPYRPAMRPYLAAKTVLLEGGVNKFDRAMVRGFLDSVSLFPVGSVVELDDGTRGRVIRATPGVQTRPVVEQVDAGGQTVDRVIDLSRDPARKVVRALTDEPALAATT